ncbi:uncharacterized protein LOC112051070 [Bicyclus anynana]|uniref:Uncharacterized protein LOC112051070 n=1 Tax=Bicyclus anynana TaxID=110368 RepID=A0A6J1NJY7_BICAN|nr:uncharacterized protein LOC112051070 [Bicyclus anynana]
MGELIEFTTLAHHQRRFYKITSSSIAFSLKVERQIRNYMCADRPAAIGLAQKSDSTCIDYWIVIKRNQCWIERDEVRVGNTKQLPNFSERNKYTKYWISWHNSRLQFGLTSDGVPIISKRTLGPNNIQYVTFDIFADRGSLQWKLFLPPPKEQAPLVKRITGGELHWVEWDGKLPEDALIGGYGKEILYIIRWKYDNSLILGNYAHSKESIYLPLPNGNLETKFEILCGYNCIWVPTVKNHIPIGAVEGGFDDVSKEKLYIGRAVVEDKLIPGKVQPSDSACSVTYNMEQNYVHRYEILVDLNLLKDNSDLGRLSILGKISDNCSQDSELSDYEDINNYGSSDSEL